MFFAEEIKIIQKQASKHQEIFDLKIILTKLLQISSKRSEEQAGNELALFCEEFHAVLNDVINSTTKSQIDAVLQKETFTSKFGTLIQIKTTNYFKPLTVEFAVSCRKPETVENLRTLLSILNLMAVGKDGVKTLAKKRKHIDEIIKQQLQDQINKLKLPFENLLKFLDGVEALIADFDSQITQLYNSPVSLLHFYQDIVFNEYGKLSDSIKQNQLPDLMMTFNRLFATRKAVYFAGDGKNDLDNLSVNIRFRYLLELRKLKKYVIKNENEPRLSSEVKKNKQQIIEKFNRKFTTLQKNLTVLSDEVKYASQLSLPANNTDLLASIAEATDEDANIPMPNNKAVISNAKVTDVNLIILSREIKAEELKNISGVNYVLRDDNPHLIFHTELFHRITSISVCFRMIYRFLSQTPQHLFEVSINHITVDLNTLNLALKKLNTEFDQVCAAVKDEQFHFEKNKQLLAVNEILANEITPIAHHISSKFSTDNLDIAQKNLPLIAGVIYKAQKILFNFSQSYNYHLARARKLVTQYAQTKIDIKEAQDSLDNYNVKFTEFQARKSFNTPNAVIITEITSFLGAMTLSLETANQIFASCPEPNDSNVLGAVMQSLNEIQITHLAKFDYNETEFTALINKETLSLANAELTNSSVYAPTSYPTTFSPVRSSKTETNEEKISQLNTSNMLR